MNKKIDIRILDKRKSSISNDEITRYRAEVTKPTNSPICPNKTFSDVFKLGAASEQERGVPLVRGQIDV